MSRSSTTVSGMMPNRLVRCLAGAYGCQWKRYRGTRMQQGDCCCNKVGYARLQQLPAQVLHNSVICPVLQKNRRIPSYTVGTTIVT